LFSRGKDAKPAAPAPRHAKDEPEIKRPLFSVSKKSEQQKMAKAARMARKNVAPAPIRAPSVTAPRVEIDPKTGKPVDQATSAAAVASRNFVDATKVTAKVRATLAENDDAEHIAREESEFQTHLLERGIVTEAQLNEAWDRHLKTHRHIFECLESLGYTTQEAIAKEASDFYSLPILDLPRQPIDPSAIDLVVESTARDYTCFPVFISPEGLLVAVAEPSERLAGILTQMSGLTVTMAISLASDIKRALDGNYHALADVAQLVEEFEAGDTQRRRPTQTSSSASIDEAADSAPIVQVVNRILSQAMRDGASDVHIEPSEDLVRVRNRVDGVLKVVLVLPAAMGLGLVSRIKIMAEMNIVERRRPQDGKFTSVVDGKEIDVRVATVATIWGESCVLRILDKTRSVLSINDLGMNPTSHATYSKMIRSPFGMVLCVGPTGSGKTTTLYASLTEISDVGRNVMTIEDPVEYVFPSINQIQTNEQAGLTFATGLKSILRQDSDIVLVGEIRDVETARIAVQSTLTGHFVLSSLHATDAVSALTRFIDMGIESFLIASAVIGIVGQRLVRRLCDGCKAPYTPTDEELAFYRRAGGPKKDVFFQGTGCNLCAHTGFKDRIGVYELLVMTQEMKRLVVGFATEDELRDMARKQGMRTMQDEAVALVASDVTTCAEVVRSIYSF
jgi:type IV pilus assembly protein PilB